MTSLELVRANLLSPIVLAFVLGALATWWKSDLRFPDGLQPALTIYLLLAIGLKGGAELAAAEAGALFGPIAATLALGLLTPLLDFAVLRRLGRLSVADSAALAAHYGSVSIVTFVATLAFLDRIGVAREGFLSALVAILEVPAILVALVLARSRLGDGSRLGAAIAEVARSKSVFLLLGGLAIGFASGAAGVEKVAPFFVTPFQGVLALFLLELGMVAARRARELAAVGPFLLLFAIVTPLLHGFLGALAGRWAGLGIGGTAVLATLAASASYIAAPAAVRVALPQANPAFYLTAALAITFPFNLVVGIPVYLGLARWAHSL